jgi:hypothetical protein
MNPYGGTALVVTLISFIYLGLHFVLPNLGHDMELPGISDATAVVADANTDGEIVDAAEGMSLPGTEMLDDAIQALKKSENKVSDDMPEEEYIALLSNSLTERLQHLGLTKTGACKIKMMVNRNGTPYAVTPSGCVGQEGFDEDVKRALMDIESLPAAPMPLYEKYKELRFKVVGKG